MSEPKRKPRVCGCGHHYIPGGIIPDPSRPTYADCPLHAAAPRMLALLKEFPHRLADFGMHGKSVCGCYVCKESRALIAEVEG